MGTDKIEYEREITVRPKEEEGWSTRTCQLVGFGSLCLGPLALVSLPLIAIMASDKAREELDL